MTHPLIQHWLFAHSAVVEWMDGLTDTELSEVTSLLLMDNDPVAVAALGDWLEERGKPRKWTELRSTMRVVPTMRKRRCRR